MSVAREDREIVERMFKAMQTGLTAETEMMALFADEAVLTETFTGEPRTHTGTEAIRACFRELWSEPEPEVELIVDRVDMDGDTVRAEWTCTAPVFPTPMRGTDRFRIRHGRIQRLDVLVTEMPAMDHDDHTEG